MHATYIIKKPLLTEKNSIETEKFNNYSFQVDMKADKQQIKAAVESLYGVRVTKVNTQIRKGKYFRTKFGSAKTSSWKKAIVHLHAEDRIELF